MCLRRELDDQGCKKMKDVLSYLELLAVDKSLQEEKPAGLEDFLV